MANQRSWLAAQEIAKSIVVGLEQRQLQVGQTIKTCLSKSFMLSQIEKDLMLYKILAVIYESSQVYERKAMGQHYDNTYNDFTYNDFTYNDEAYNTFT